MTPASLARLSPWMAVPLVVLAAVAGGPARADAAPVHAGALVVAFQPPPASAAAPEGFEPVSSLPPAQREQIPAAPMVMAAYAFVWAAILVYLWSIWRRLGVVERELGSVARRVDEAGRRQ